MNLAQRTLLGLLCIVVLSTAQAESSQTEAVPLSSDLRVSVRAGREIGLEVRVREGDRFETIAERICGGREPAAAIAAWNNLDEIQVDEWIAIPFALVSENYRRFTLAQLFPEDRLEGGNWIHHPKTGRGAFYDQGMWEVALWFTGRGELFTELLSYNEMSSPELQTGAAIRIPAKLLHPAFDQPERSEDGALIYDSDEIGPYAGYDLKPGEALYSSVIVRFTGRTKGEDVIASAEALQQRNRIQDLSDIPIGFRIKIPLEMLEPQFLPAKHPRRLAAEEASAAIVAELEREPVTGTRDGLRGVVIVIDPGHGGRDIGTNHNGVWEHDYVYDVACRLKTMLEARTEAVVKITLEDRETGCRPSKGDKLKQNFQGTVLTNPPFLVENHRQTDMGVNLRWYLANSIYRRARKQNFKSDRVIFLSLHADARHKSLRGVMAYVPGASYRTRTYGFSSPSYQRFAEVREKSHVRFGKQTRVRSEALSNRLAEAIVEGFREEKLPVQPYQPVRNRIIRGKSKFVPAVIRGNIIPTKVLVEMVNISNNKDASLLQKAEDRGRMARAVYRAIFSHFGETPPK